MNLIVAVSSNWGIGHGGELLFRIPADLARFKEITMGKTVLMGRKTYFSLPESVRPLPGRKNAVLSRSPGLSIPGAVVFGSKEAAAEALAFDDVFVIGGDEVYRLLLGDCRRALVTKVSAAPPADCFFPNLDESPDWRLVEKSEMLSGAGFEFAYWEYERVPK